MIAPRRRRDVFGQLIRPGALVLYAVQSGRGAVLRVARVSAVQSSRTTLLAAPSFKKRPGSKALVDVVEAGRPPFQVLIVSEQSRLGRDLVRTLYAIQTTDDAGVRIFAPLTDHEVTAKGTDKLRAVIGGISDEDVIEKSSVRMKAQMKDRARDGFVAAARCTRKRSETSRQSRGVSRFPSWERRR